jgi:hypothetical protein
MQDRICRIDESLLQRTAGPYIWVNSTPAALRAATAEVLQKADEIAAAPRTGSSCRKRL